MLVNRFIKEFIKYLAIYSALPVTLGAAMVPVSSGFSTAAATYATPVVILLSILSASENSMRNYIESRDNLLKEHQNF